MYLYVHGKVNNNNNNSNNNNSNNNDNNEDNENEDNSRRNSDAPSWVKDLRNQWEDEIEHNMPSEQKEWFQTESTQQNALVSSLRKAWNSEISGVTKDKDDNIIQKQIISEQMNLFRKDDIKSEPISPKQTVVNETSVSDIDRSDAEASVSSLSTIPIEAETVCVTEREMQMLKEHKTILRRVKTEPIKSKPTGFISRWFGKRNDSSSSIDHIYTNATIIDYANRVKMSLDSHESQIMTLQTQRRIIRMRMRKELQQWRDYAIHALVELGTKLYSSQLVWLSTLLDVEFYYCDVLNRVINTIQMSLDSNDPTITFPEAFKDNESQTGFREATDIERVLAGPVVDGKIRQCRNMARQLSQLQKNYDAMQKRLSEPITNEQRCFRLNQLIRRTLEDLCVEKNKEKLAMLYYHPHNIRGEREFERIIMDQRHSEGKLIKQWRELLKQNIESITPLVILQFLDKLTADILEKFEVRKGVKTYVTNGLVSDEIVHPIEKFIEPCLRLFIDRMLFPLIKPIVMSMTQETQQNADIRLEKNLWWLRCLTEEECGIINHFCSPETGPLSSKEDESTLVRHERPLNIDKVLQLPTNELTKHLPYSNAIYALSGIKDGDVPVDMLHCTLEAIRSINQTARLYYNAHKENKCSNLLQTLGIDGRDEELNEDNNQVITSRHSNTNETDNNNNNNHNHNHNHNNNHNNNTNNNNNHIENSNNIANNNNNNNESNSDINNASHSNNTSTSDLNGFSPLSDTSPIASPQDKTKSFAHQHPFYANAVKPGEPTNLPKAVAAQIHTVDVDADSLFPIVLWTVIHADIPNLHSTLSSMERLLPENQKLFGETGMCLALIEAAVYYLDEVKPEDFPSLGLTSNHARVAVKNSNNNDKNDEIENEAD